MKRYFGAHVSAAGGLVNSLRNGRELNINTIQIHPAPPQRWNSKPYAAGIEDKFLAEREKSGVEKVFFHAIYLINLANPDPQQFHLSKLSLQHHLDLSQRISGDGVIFHVGSAKDQESDESGFERAADGVNWILENTPGKGRLIMEVAAGSGKIIGDRLEELQYIYDRIEDKARVGFALDSQHLWASGYDLQNDLEDFVKNVEKAFSLEKVWAFHLNDSKTELGSRKDRHENLGDGLIGKDALSALINHKKFLAVPFILETPGLKDLEGAATEVEKLRAIIG
jgi:apurinic endonuclease APN1